MNQQIDDLLHDLLELQNRLHNVINLEIEQKFQNLLLKNREDIEEINASLVKFENEFKKLILNLANQHLVWSKQPIRTWSLRHIVGVNLSTLEAVKFHNIEMENWIGTIYGFFLIHHRQQRQATHLQIQQHFNNKFYLTNQRPRIRTNQESQLHRQVIR